MTIRNLRLDYARPMLTETRIAGFEGGRTILDYDCKRCPMMVKDGRLFMVGEGFTNRVRSCRLFDGRTFEQTPGAEDVFLAENIFVRLPDGKISVDADLSKYGVGCKVGDVAVLRPDKRDNPAIVVYNSKNVLFEDVVVHDAKGMVLIAQRSENVTWRGTGKAEDKTSGVFPRPGGYATSHADATHFSNVKGAVIVENSWFEGMMDDAINVHSTCHKGVSISTKIMPDGSAKVFANVKVKGQLPFVKSISPVPEAWGGDVRIENRIVGEDGMVTKHPKASSLQTPFPCKLETKLFYVGRVVDVVTNSFAVPIR